jgi:hypothetical protein
MKKMIALASVIALGGLAIAQPKAPDPKAGSGSAAKAPDKKAPDAGAGSAAAKAPEMKPPAPPAEVAAMGKMMAGNWKCAGKMAMDPTNPANMTDFKGTYKAATDPSKFWVKGDWAGGPGGKMKGTMLLTYDAGTKKWYRHMTNNMGGGGMESSSGLPAGATEGKMVWEGRAHGMGMEMQTRVTEEVAAKSVKMTHEGSMDNGKTWKTGMEMTCTK